MAPVNGDVWGDRRELPPSYMIEASMNKLIFIAVLALSASAQRTTPPPMIVKCGTLIQPHTRQVLRNVAIHVVNGKIIRVGPAAEITAPGAQIIDYGDRYIIPGLVDLHAHTYTQFLRGTWNTSNEKVPVFLLAAGVTTARAPGSMNPGADLAMRNRIDSGLMLGPRYHFAGEYIDLAPSQISWFNPSTSAGEIRMKIDQWSAQGATAIKLYTHISGEPLQAAVAHAHQHGLKVVGHVDAVGWKEAMEAGVDELCHGVAALPEAGLKPPKWEGADKIDWRSPKFAEILKLAAQLRVVLAPTAVAFENIKLDPAWKQFYSEEAWKSLEEAQAKGAWGIPETFGTAQKAFIRAAYEAGCLLGTGTDHVVPVIPPGISLWRELAIFREAGLPPMDVLAAATWTGIYSIGRTDLLGTIEPGKLADFVVLDADPLADIANVRRVYRVVKAGVVYDPAKILAGLKGALN
jgi:imidazolonepropionase-like amidohydrolase